METNMQEPQETKGNYSPGGERPRSRLISVLVLIAVVGFFIYIAMSAGNSDNQSTSESDQAMATDTPSEIISDDDQVLAPNIEIKPEADPIVPPPVGTQPDEPDMPVKFGCVVSGCNNEICTSSAEPVYTACVALKKYECYKTATCELQSDGSCGWTQTSSLQQCLMDAEFYD